MNVFLACVYVYHVCSLEPRRRLPWSWSYRRCELLDMGVPTAQCTLQEQYNMLLIVKPALCPLGLPSFLLLFFNKIKNGYMHFFLF